MGAGVREVWCKKQGMITMNKSLKAVLGAATLAASVMLAGAVSAATTFVFTGTGQTQLVKNNDLGLGLNDTTIDFISGDLKSAANGLSITGSAKIKFTYLGREAGNRNFAADLGGIFFQTNTSSVGDVYLTAQLGAGLIDFAFGTSRPQQSVGRIENSGVANPQSKDYAIGYVKLSDTSYIALFDDIARSDRDFDDIGVQIDISAIPLPAGGVLLLTALGGVAALRRRKA